MAHHAYAQYIKDMGYPPKQTKHLMAFAQHKGIVVSYKDVRNVVESDPKRNTEPTVTSIIPIDDDIQPKTQNEIDDMNLMQQEPVVPQIEANTDHDDQLKQITSNALGETDDGGLSLIICPLVHHLIDLKMVSLPTINRVLRLLPQHAKSQSFSFICQLFRFVFTKPQLFSFVFDAYGLIRYNQLLGDSHDQRVPIRNIHQFIQHYSSMQQILNWCQSSNIHGNVSDITSLVANVYHKYCVLFGQQMSLEPNIKIKDSMYIFLSYIFGYNRN
eukprot:410868_1